jgi:hypothetical protein
MTSTRFEILTRRLRLHAHVNAYDLDALKANLNRPDNAEARETLRAQLDDLIDTLAIPRDEYEALTGEAFDDDAEYRAALQGIRATLFP